MRLINLAVGPNSAFQKITQPVLCTVLNDIQTLSVQWNLQGRI
jgi:hypothetical protein